jgi:ligand-binding sensor domain-containing protein/signal transduction histidine kinase
MLRRILLSVLCTLMGMAGALAEEVAPLEMLYRKWDTQSGLPQNSVRTIIRTRDGFLWVGTEGGLARFDGQRFTAYGLREGLLSDYVRVLFESSDGTLWIGTRGGGLSAMRDGRIVRTYARADGLPSSSANFITEDSEKHIWVGSSFGVARLENDRFVSIPRVPGTVYAVYCDRQGVIWGAFPGLWRWEAGRWSEEPGGPGAAFCFCEDELGQLWVGGAGHSLWCREPGGWRLHVIPDSIAGTYPLSIAAESDGTIWIVMEGGEMCGFRNGHFIRPVPRSEQAPRSTLSAYVDPDGQLWMGSYSRGLYALTSPLTSTITLAGGEENNTITALAETEPGTFVVGTSAHGWFSWRDGKTSPLLESGEFPNIAYGNRVLVTRDKSVWAASNEALLLFRNGRRIPQPALDPLFTGLSVIALCEDRASGIWAGISNGKLYHINAEAVTPVTYGERLQGILALEQESDGTLWIGTIGDGLFRLRGGGHRRFGRESGLRSEVVRAIYISPEGTLWIGTGGGGLARRDGERFVSVSTDEGLPDSTISQITQDDEGRLWLGTNRGLAVLSREEVAAIRADHSIYLHPLLITKADGMPAEECMPSPPVKTSAGQLAFPTTNGVVLLRPGVFHTDSLTPPVFIEEIQANDQVVAAEHHTLSLPPSADRLQIRFTALHFAAPEDIRFRYRLSGLEKDWVQAGTRRVVDYSHLSPGRYRFEVSASIGNGLWNPKPAMLEIVRAPHFWQTWWFIGAAIGSTLTAVALLVRRRERLRAQHRIEKLERQQAVDSERARISRDLHDDVGASLTQVALLSELAQDDLTADPERARATINEIFTTAQDVTRNLDEIVWAVNPAHDTLENFVLYLCNFAQNYTRTAGLQSRLDIPKTLPSTIVGAPIRHHVYLATKEVLHNAVKHAEATEIRIGLVVEPGWFRLTITDNGKGFSPSGPSSDPGADGVSNLQQRLQTLRGACTYTSQPGAGTSVEMAVPLP